MVYEHKIILFVFDVLRDELFFFLFILHIYLCIECVQKFSQNHTHTDKRQRQTQIESSNTIIT